MRNTYLIKVLNNLYKKLKNSIVSFYKFFTANIAERKRDLNLIKGINTLNTSLITDFDKFHQNKNFEIDMYGIGLSSDTRRVLKLNSETYTEVYKNVFVIVCSSFEETLVKVENIIKEKNLKKLSGIELIRIKKVVDTLLTNSSNFVMIVSHTKDSKIDLHYHISTEYNYVIRGKCKNRLTNSTYGEHSLFVHLPFEIHSVESLTDNLILLVSLDNLNTYHNNKDLQDLIERK